MKIICIKNYKSQGLQLELTYGKSYDTHGGLENLLIDSYCIRNDRNRVEYYSKADFVTQDEWRDLKLKEIGI